MKNFLILSLFLTTLFAQWPHPLYKTDFSGKKALFSEEGTTMQLGLFVDEDASIAIGVTPGNLGPKIIQKFEKNDITIDQDCMSCLLLQVDVTTKSPKFEGGQETGLLIGDLTFSVIRRLSDEDDVLIPAIVWWNERYWISDVGEAEESMMVVMIELINTLSIDFINHNR